MIKNGLFFVVDHYYNWRGVSLPSGPGRVFLVGLCMRSHKQGRMPRPLLGHPLLSVWLDLKENDGGRQSADALQDLVDPTRPCSCHLLTRFVSRKFLAVLLLVLLFLSTDFRSGVPFPLGTPLIIGRIGVFAPSYRLRTPPPSQWTFHPKVGEGRPGTSLLTRRSGGYLVTGSLGASSWVTPGGGGSGIDQWRLRRRRVAAGRRDVLT